MDITKKLLAGFMAASMIAISGCSHTPDRNDDNEEKGIITSTWNNDSNSWHHYQRYNGIDHYLYSGPTPYEGTSYSSNGIYKSNTPVAISKSSSGTVIAPVSSAAKGGISSGGGRSAGASAAS